MLAILLLVDPPREVGKLPPRAGNGRVGAHTGDHADGVIALRQRNEGVGERRVDVDFRRRAQATLRRETKRRRKHADDETRLTVDEYVLTDERRVGEEALVPELAAQHHDACRTGRVLVRRESAAEHGPGAE